MRYSTLQYNIHSIYVSSVLQLPASIYIYIFSFYNHTSYTILVLSLLHASLSLSKATKHDLGMTFWFFWVRHDKGISFSSTLDRTRILQTPQSRKREA